ncbi:Zinc-binding domain of primase-helicase [Pirellula sp. SH-Sr6A]|uniref:primase-helicase zinc-binding domain-containing protein n=1 Tax=Pirellula sp. SH-Sr6A TaxID=1632865 RepID=UPI00078E0D30|nr:primase-helicase zinc-binding domain-containing protein [Pirellula sp. SH-Sr6A]AMV31584.1 Zinc-binding domain of primase-helicase [Pirellula sp. SH-Sr6A]
MIVDAIKQAAHGRWRSILALPLTRDDAGGQPCPKCGGEDRFHTDREFDDNGKVYCRGCLSKGSGDGISTFAWFNGIENKEAIKQLASELGVSVDRDNAPKRDLIEAVCIEKRMPVDAFKQFEPTLAKRGNREVVRVPVWNSKGEKHSYFDLWSNDKGKFARARAVVAPSGAAAMVFPTSLFPVASVTMI